MALPIYLINLAHRQDRLSTMTEHLHSLGLKFHRIDAIDGKKLVAGVHPSPNNVAACWLSHQEVAREFLATDEPYALVLEDDSVINSRCLPFINGFKVEPGFFDIFQLGYNVQQDKVASGYSDSRLRIRRKVECSVQKVTNEIIRRKLNICELHDAEDLFIPGIPMVSNIFETGTHAYVISRKAAVEISKFNNPVLLPADIALSEMSKSKDLRMFRPALSMANQSDSISSIPDISNEVLETQLHSKTKILCQC